jgi:hypothetical protein
VILEGMTQRRGRAVIKQYEHRPSANAAEPLARQGCEPRIRSRR